MEYCYPIETKSVVGVIEGGDYYYPTVVTFKSMTTTIPTYTRAKAQRALYRMLRRRFKLTLNGIRSL